MVKKIITNTIIRTAVIPAFLLLFWIVVTLIYIFTQNGSFTVLWHDHENDVSLSPISGSLTAGNKITGRFTAKENNLGIFALRLQNHNSGFVEEDTITFSMKEIGSQQTYFQQDYSGGQFHELEHFTFGFPIIQDSKGKVYVFEIESKEGGQDNKLTLKRELPQVITKYQFSTQEIFRDPQFFIRFVGEKWHYGLKNPTLPFTSFVYLIPFLLYCIMISRFSYLVNGPVNKLLAGLKFVFVKMPGSIGITTVTTLDVIIFIGIVITILLFPQIKSQDEPITLFLCILWIFQLWRMKYDSRISLIFVFFLFLVIPVFISLNKLEQAEKAAMWAYLFILIGVIHNLIALYFPRVHEKKT